MILTLYLHISLICLILYMIYLTMVKCHIGKELDPFKQLQDLQESIEQLDEKSQNFINNFVNNCIANPNSIFILSFIFSFMPVIHIVFIYTISKSIIEKFN